MNINLLPWRQKQQCRQRCLFYSGWLTSLLFTGAVIGFFHFSLRHSIQLEKNRMTLLAHQLSAFPVVDAQRLRKIDKILDQRDIISPIRLLSEALPKQCILTQLSLESGEWTLTGISSEARAVWNFIQKLEKTKLFHSVSITHLTQKAHVLFTLRLSRAH